MEVLPFNLFLFILPKARCLHLPALRRELKERMGEGRRRHGDGLEAMREILRDNNLIEGWFQMYRR
jgi:hypothetical protein